MVSSLKEQLSSPDKRKALVNDALDLLNAEVKEKSGLSGLAVKGAFKIIQGVQPGFLHRVIEHLLDDFLEQIDPFYQSALSDGLTPGGLLVSQKSKVASALLSVTDRKAEKTTVELVKRTYKKLRPAAVKHVETASPRLATLLDKHAQPS